MPMICLILAALLAIPSLWRGPHLSWPMRIWISLDLHKDLSHTSIQRSKIEIPMIYRDSKFLCCLLQSPFLDFSGVYFFLQLFHQSLVVFITLFQFQQHTDSFLLVHEFLHLAHELMETCGGFLSQFDHQRSFCIDPIKQGSEHNVLL